MLDNAKLLKDATAQELVASLIRQAVCGAFNAEQVLTDLYGAPHLWRSFWMGPLLSVEGASLLPLSLLMLRDLREGWNADTLYVLAASSDAASELVMFAEPWAADSVRTVAGEQAQTLLGAYDGSVVVMY